jgi:carbonic anhydrase/acetyltransferase-like protein (isoleucine patch superfamily)
MGAIVLNGANIGEGSLIGAGAVITEGMAIPARSVVVGIPARVIKQTSDAQMEYILNNASSYSELAEEYSHHG